MPNKYQREIEEILRNMERTEPKPSLGNRIRSFNRPRRPHPRRPRRSWQLALNASEICLLIGIALILLAAAITFYFGPNQPTLFGDNQLRGWLGVAGFIVFVVGLVIGWRHYFRSGRASAPGWRGSDYASPGSASSSSAYTPPSRAEDDNVVRMSTRRRRNPFSALITQLRILRLKLRYQRIRERENSESSEAGDDAEK